MVRWGKLLYAVLLDGNRNQRYPKGLSDNIKKEVKL